MNSRATFARLLVRLFALALRLYPQATRREYAAEMQAVFSLQVTDAARRGAAALLLLICREARDLPASIFAAHLQVDGGRMRQFFPSTSDQTPWGAALLSLAPFFIATTLRVVVNFQPGWRPEQASLRYFWFLVFSCLPVFAGLALGALKGFPRWVYPYLFYLPFGIYTALTYAAYQFGWSNDLQNSFWLIQVLILLVLGLPGLRTFYRRIAQDWTLLSYGLFGFVLYLFSTLDKDETPVLTLMVLLPSLLSLGAALAHLRIRSAYARILVLLAGTFFGLFFFLLPIFTNMITIMAGILVGTSVLLVYGSILTALLLAPLLVTGAIRTWRASHPPR
jgi:hypothetical protein